MLLAASVSSPEAAHSQGISEPPDAASSVIQTNVSRHSRRFNRNIPPLQFEAGQNFQMPDVWTLEFWFDPAWATLGTSGKACIISRTDSSKSDRTAWEISIVEDDETKTLQLAVWDGQGDLDERLAGPNPGFVWPLDVTASDSNAHHVALAFSPSGATLYLNGRRLGELSGALIDDPVSGTLTIGASVSDGKFRDHFEGYLGGFRFWRVRVRSETLQYYLDPGPISVMNTMMRHPRFNPDLPAGTQQLTEGRKLQSALVAYTKFTEQRKLETPSQASLEFTDPLHGFWVPQDAGIKATVHTVSNVNAFGGAVKRTEWTAYPTYYLASWGRDLHLYRNGEFAGRLDRNTLLLTTPSNRKVQFRVGTDKRLDPTTNLEYVVGQLSCIVHDEVELGGTPNGTRNLVLQRMTDIERKAMQGIKGTNSAYDAKLDTIKKHGDPVKSTGSLLAPYDITKVDPFCLVKRGTMQNLKIFREAPAIGDNDLGLDVPANMSVYFIPEGKASESETFFSNSSDLTSGLRVLLGANIDVPGFKMSGEYEKDTEVQQVFKGEKTLVAREEVMRYYAARLNPQRAELDSVFYNDVLRLEAGNNMSLQQFREKWGTHYCSGVVLGAKALFTQVIDRKEYEKRLKNQVNLKAEAEGAFKGFGGGVKGEYEKRNEAAFKKELESNQWTCRSFGATAPSRDEPMQAAPDDAAPIELDLRPLYELLSPRYFENPRIYTELRHQLKMANLDYIQGASTNVPASESALPMLAFSITPHSVTVRENDSGKMKQNRILGGKLVLSAGPAHIVAAPATAIQLEDRAYYAWEFLPKDGKAGTFTHIQHPTDNTTYTLRGPWNDGGSPPIFVSPRDQKKFRLTPSIRNVEEVPTILTPNPNPAHFSKPGFGQFFVGSTDKDGKGHPGDQKRRASAYKNLPGEVYLNGGDIELLTSCPENKWQHGFVEALSEKPNETLTYRFRWAWSKERWSTSVRLPEEYYQSFSNLRKEYERPDVPGLPIVDEFVKSVPRGYWSFDGNTLDHVNGRNLFLGSGLDRYPVELQDNSLLLQSSRLLRDDGRLADVPSIRFSHPGRAFPGRGFSIHMDFKLLKDNSLLIGTLDENGPDSFGLSVINGRILFEAPKSGTRRILSPRIVSLNQWHKLILSFDIRTRKLITIFNGRQLPVADLDPSFQMVNGVAPAQWKFTGYAGQAANCLMDELMFFDSSMNEQTRASLAMRPRQLYGQSAPNGFTHIDDYRPRLAVVDPAELRKATDPSIELSDLPDFSQRKSPRLTGLPPGARKSLVTYFPLDSDLVDRSGLRVRKMQFLNSPKGIPFSDQGLKLDGDSVRTVIPTFDPRRVTFHCDFALEEPGGTLVRFGALAPGATVDVSKHEWLNGDLSRYGWLAVDTDKLGQLWITVDGLNGPWRLPLPGGLIRDREWHKIVCSVDLAERYLCVFLDGRRRYSGKIGDEFFEGILEDESRGIVPDYVTFDVNGQIDEVIVLANAYVPATNESTANAVDEMVKPLDLETLTALATRQRKVAVPHGTRLQAEYAIREWGQGGYPGKARFVRWTERSYPELSSPHGMQYSKTGEEPSHERSILLITVQHVTGGEPFEVQVSDISDADKQWLLENTGVDLTKEAVVSPQAAETTIVWYCPGLKSLHLTESKVRADYLSGREVALQKPGDPARRVIFTIDQKPDTSGKLLAQLQEELSADEFQKYIQRSMKEFLATDALTNLKADLEDAVRDQDVLLLEDVSIVLREEAEKFDALRMLELAAKLNGLSQTLINSDDSDSDKETWDSVKRITKRMLEEAEFLKGISEGKPRFTPQLG